MKLQISGGQLSKLKRGKVFQLSKDQLQGIPKKGKQYQVDIDDSNMKKIEKARKGGKGYRVKGGNIFNDVSKGVNKAVKTVSDTVSGASKSATKKVKGLSKAISSVGDYVKNDAVDDIEDAYGEVNQFALKNDIGGKVEMAKKVVPKSAAQAAFSGALMAAGMDKEAADVMAASAVGAVYNVDFGKSLKGQGKKAASGAIQGGVSEGVKSSKTTKGDGVKGINHLGNDYAKKAFSGRSVSFAPAVMSPAPRAVKVGKAPSKTKVAKAKNQQMVDTNTSSGGNIINNISKKAGFSSSGGSFKPVSGGSFKEVGGSGISKPAKGSQAAKDKMASLRAMRKKKTAGGSFKAV
jgi:hypothetical protein